MEEKLEGLEFAETACSVDVVVVVVVIGGFVVFVVSEERFQAATEGEGAKGEGGVGEQEESVEGGVWVCHFRKTPSHGPEAIETTTCRLKVS